MHNNAAFEIVNSIFVYLFQEDLGVHALSYTSIVLNIPAKVIGGGVSGGF